MFGWDFLYLPETRQAVVWDSITQATAPIEDAAFLDKLDYKGCNLLDIWQGILDVSEEITPEQVGAVVSDELKATVSRTQGAPKRIPGLGN